MYVHQTDEVQSCTTRKKLPKIVVNFQTVVSVCELTFRMRFESFWASPLCLRIGLLQTTFAGLWSTRGNKDIPFVYVFSVWLWLLHPAESNEVLQISFFLF